MTKKLALKRICRGLYVDHKAGMALEHEAVWRVSEGRKWIAEWTEATLRGLGAPEKRTRKFDKATEARAFLTRLLNGGQW